MKIKLFTETIAGRLKEKYGVKIHYEIIYRCIYKDITDLTQYLLRRKPGQKRNSCLTVMVDRASRKTIIKKTASKTSVETAKSILKAMKPYQNIIKSITYDNGCEFSKHEKINKELNIKSYFCKPYHSWEKGTVENINGLIRRFFPKGTNFDTISEEAISYVEDWINNRPMKILNYMTPNQKFQLLGVAIAS